jgi:hypothetical protein
MLFVWDVSRNLLNSVLRGRDLHLNSDFTAPQLLLLPHLTMPPPT